MAAMKIGEIAKRSGISIETIRYYEREGLLLEPERRPSGYRQFDESTVERLEYIRRAKDLGFTLAEIRDLLELSFAAHVGCNHIRPRAEAKVVDIERKIRSLQQMKRSLEKIIRHCRAKNSADDCPLLHKPKPKTSP
jgi:DNA-binding transcriptional MerR regulator